MAKAKKQNKAKTKEEIIAKIKQLSDRARETGSQQLDLIPAELGDEDIDLGFDTALLKDTADPEESYRLYYGIRRLLMDNLPPGKPNKKLRQSVYDEKNMFLNRGENIKPNGVRGSDGRQTYIQPFLREAFTAVTNWIMTGANPFDIFMAFRTMNEEKGYYSNKPAEGSTAESTDTPEPLEP